MSAAEVLHPPRALPLTVNTIPAELRALDQWVVWEWELRDGLWTKPPINARTGGAAKSNTRATWSSFDVALHRYQDTDDYPGIGFVTCADDPFCYVDLDKCRDPDTGTIADWAIPILVAFKDTYQEISPSRTGIKIIARGTLPAGGKSKPVGTGKLEIYDQKYTTITGAMLDGVPCELTDQQEALNQLLARYWPPKPAAERIVHLNRDQLIGGRGTNAHVLLAKACAAKNGADFARLFYDGDLSAYGGDHSRGDQALANHLAFYFGPDPNDVAEMFRQSALYRPDKCEAKHRGDGATYLEMTIEKALADRTEFYTEPASVTMNVPTVNANGKPPTGEQDAGDDQTEEPESSTGERGPDSDQSTSADEEPKPVGRIVIDAGDQDLERVSGMAWRAIKRVNTPARLFRFGGLPVRIDGAEDDHPITQPLTADLMSYEAARAAKWIKTTKDQTKDASPPLRVIRDMLAYPVLPLPPLIGIVRTPVYAPDGTLHDQPGYHPEARTFYAPAPGFVVPKVPTKPTAADVARAKALIVDEVFGDFAFTGQAERANAIALFIEPYARLLISGTTPLRMIEAPTPGVGKGLLVASVLIPAVGREVTAMPAANDDDEWRKRITAQLMQSPVAIPIDNITKPLDSGALAAALTADFWTDRRLGGNEMVRVPVNCLWLATANNPAMSTEIARRTVRIRIDPKIDQPWRRKGPDGELEWRHADLKQWIHQQRGELVWAALTLIRHWLAEGSPMGETLLGSYERWAKVMGGILGAADIDGFLGNLDVFYEAADLEGAIWRQFVLLWAEEHGTSKVGASDLFPLALQTEGFDLGGGSDRSQRVAFGIALNRQRDRVIEGFRIVNVGEVKRIKQWRLISISDPMGQAYDTDAKGDHERWTA